MLPGGGETQQRERERLAATEGGRRMAVTATRSVWVMAGAAEGGWQSHGARARVIRLMQGWCRPVFKIEALI